MAPFVSRDVDVLGDRAKGVGIRRNRTCPVSGLNEGQKINKSLWELAGEFANN